MRSARKSDSFTAQERRWALAEVVLLWLVALAVLAGLIWFDVSRWLEVR